MTEHTNESDKRADQRTNLPTPAITFPNPDAYPVISMRVSHGGPRIHLGHVEDKGDQSLRWSFDHKTHESSAIADHLEGALADISAIAGIEGEITRLEKEGYQFTGQDRSVLKAVQHDLENRKPMNFPDEQARKVYENGLEGLEDRVRQIGREKAVSAPAPVISVTPVAASASLSMETGGRYSFNATVERAQQAMLELKTLGVAGIDLGSFGAGKNGVDGNFGPKTRGSLIAAQKALGMEPDGKITDEFMQNLNVKVSALKVKPDAAPASHFVTDTQDKGLSLFGQRDPSQLQAARVQYQADMAAFYNSLPEKQKEIFTDPLGPFGETDAHGHAPVLSILQERRMELEFAHQANKDRFVSSLTPEQVKQWKILSEQAGAAGQNFSRPDDGIKPALQAPFTSFVLGKPAQPVPENFMPDMQDLRVISLKGDPEKNRQNVENLARINDVDARIDPSQVQNLDFGAATQVQAAAKLQLPKL